MVDPSLGEQELALLRHLADKGGATVGEAAGTFGAPRGLARSTVLTMMERLRRKGTSPAASAAAYRLSVILSEIPSDSDYDLSLWTPTGTLLNESRTAGNADEHWRLTCFAVSNCLSAFAWIEAWAARRARRIDCGLCGRRCNN